MGREEEATLRRFPCPENRSAPDIDVILEGSGLLSEWLAVGDRPQPPLPAP